MNGYSIGTVRHHNQIERIQHNIKITKNSIAIFRITNDKIEYFFSPTLIMTSGNTDYPPFIYNILQLSAINNKNTICIHTQDNHAYCILGVKINNPEQSKALVRFLINLLDRRYVKGLYLILRKNKQKIIFAIIIEVHKNFCARISSLIFSFYLENKEQISISFLTPIAIGDILRQNKIRMLSKAIGNNDKQIYSFVSQFINILISSKAIGNENIKNLDHIEYKSLHNNTSLLQTQEKELNIISQNTVDFLSNVNENKNLPLAPIYNILSEKLIVIIDPINTNKICIIPKSILNTKKSTKQENSNSA